MKIRVFDDAPAITAELSTRWATWQELDSIFLSGGSTFQDLYATAPSTAAQLFLADERYVPQSAHESTQGMIAALYLSRFKEANFSAPDPSLPLPESVAGYAKLLEEWYRKEERFSIALLGIGSDGHTASLFPKHYQSLAETQEWVVAAEPELPPIVKRITVTPALLRHVDELIFVATGETKRDIIRQIVEKQADLPVTHLLTNATLYLDRAAAADLTIQPA